MPLFDLGCGGGDPVAMSLVERRLKVIGIAGSDYRDTAGSSPTCRTLALGERFDAVLARDSFFHPRPDNQAAMFAVFAAHAAPGGVLKFNGPARGEAIGAYRGDPLHHASLDAAEYERLLDGVGFDLLEHVVGDVDKGGRVVWIAKRR